MMTAFDLNELKGHDYPAYVRAQRRELALLDRLLAEKERVAANAVADTHRQAVADLSALGIEDPLEAWVAGVTETRLWLLTIASGGEFVAPSAKDYTRVAGEWVAAAFVATPLDEWRLWQYTALFAMSIRDARLRRCFGTPEVTTGDFEEARLHLGFAHEHWVSIRSRAAWVLRGMLTPCAA